MAQIANMVRFCIFIVKADGRKEVVYDLPCVVTGSSVWSWAEAREKRKVLAMQEPDAKVWLAVVCLPVAWSNAKEQFLRAGLQSKAP